MQGLVHIPHEMKDPAERHRSIASGGAPYDVQIGLIRAQHIFWRWFDGLHARRLSLGFIRQIDKVPGAMMERWIRADIVGPAGREHEEKHIPFIRGDK